MKNFISYIFALLVILPLLMTFASCDDETSSNFNIAGDTYISAFVLDGYNARIDNVNKTVEVNVPYGFDASAMRLSAISMSEGAKADVVVGEVIDCRLPRNIRITNGDVFTDYTLTVAHDNAYFTSFVIDNKYIGTIDNEARTIMVFVPLDANLTSMLVNFTLNEGATASIDSNSIVDFTNPVVFTITCRSAIIEYTVTVIRNEMSQEPKAFVGNGDSVEALSYEARAAAQWMLANVPNTTFVSLQDILNGTVKLNEFKMIWCHFDWTDWPGLLWDTRDMFNDYYIKGGNILASRDGARYINDVWRIALDQQSPNNMFGGDASLQLTDDLGFSIAGNESHEIYVDLPVTDNRILLVSAGCTNTNRTLQWAVDWEPYFSMSGWEEKTGAKSIASDNSGDVNHCTIAEFVPREVLKGYQSGVVIIIGTPAFEWYQYSGVNSYRPVMEKFTKNVINYLCK